MMGSPYRREDMEKVQHGRKHCVVRQTWVQSLDLTCPGTLGKSFNLCEYHQ